MPVEPEDHPATGIGVGITPRDAAKLLGVVKGARRRARDAVHRCWLVSTLLGLTLVVGTRVNRLFYIDTVTGRHCPRGLAAVNGSACEWVIRTTQKRQVAAGPVKQVIAAVLTGKVPRAWSLGASWLYWVIAITVVVALLVVVQMPGATERPSSRVHVHRLAVFAGAAIAGASVDVNLRQISAVASLANVAASAVVIGVIAVADRSRRLAAAGCLALVSTVVLVKVMPGIILPHQQLTLPPASVVQIIAGVILLVAGIGMGWRSRATFWRLPFLATFTAGRGRLRA